jgi:hypothetical protein
MLTKILERLKIKRRPTFLLGVGAQKAGTTWLYQRLKALESVKFGELKEYHYWDHLFHSDVVPGPNNKMADINLRRREVQQLLFSEPKGYENYFLSLINGGASLTGDITPSYGCLNEDQFQIIGRRIREAGFKLRVVFIMRDPVERNWSAQRMARRRKLASGVVKPDHYYAQSFRQFYQEKGMQRRTRYDLTVEALESAFTEDERHFVIFEEMFTPNSLVRLSKFIGVDSDIFSEHHKKVNSSPKLELPPAEAIDCQSYFAPVYEYCYEHFPSTRALWPKRDGFSSL